MKAKPCPHCDATHHQPYEDGLVDCRNNLFAQVVLGSDIIDDLRAKLGEAVTDKTTMRNRIDRLKDENERFRAALLDIERMTWDPNVTKRGIGARVLEAIGGVPFTMQSESEDK